VIVLPEQSMASERAGMAVNKRGLTLRELLQQTVHYNPKVRRGELTLCLCTARCRMQRAHVQIHIELFMLGSSHEYAVFLLLLKLH
jgi:hypothetical protein